MHAVFILLFAKYPIFLPFISFHTCCDEVLEGATSYLIYSFLFLLVFYRLVIFKRLTPTQPYVWRIKETCDSWVVPTVNVVDVGLLQSMVKNARPLHPSMHISMQVESFWTFIVLVHWMASVTTFQKERLQLVFPLETAKIGLMTRVTRTHAGIRFVVWSLRKSLQCNEYKKQEVDRELREQYILYWLSLLQYT
jgi:hypothetical protein